MMINPLVTVVMPIYNCELFVYDAIQSILNQTYNNFELLIIDDCSTDNTIQIVESFTDERIRVIKKKINTGYTNSLNLGIKEAKGKYIARMDGDDISLPLRFEKQVAFLEVNEQVILCGTIFSIIGTGKMIEVPENHNDIKVGLLLESKFAHPSVMLRKTTLVDHEIFYDNLMEPVEDYDLWVRLSRIGELHNLQECLLEYRVHDAQISNIKKVKQLELSKYTRLKLLLFLDKDVFSHSKDEVYLKSIDVYEKMNFEEFLQLVDLKKKLVECNSVKGFFDEKGFYSYWSSVESRFNGYYFRNRSSYSLKILKQYIAIHGQLNDKLVGKDLIKLIIKSILNYQVK